MGEPFYVRCVFGEKLFFLVTFLLSRFQIRGGTGRKKNTNLTPTLMDYSWISAAVVERLVTMNCTKYVSGLELLLSICRHWLMSDYFCTLVSHPLILERFLTISKGGMSEISISFLGVAPLLKLWNNILLWKFVEIIIISSMCD